MQFSCSCCNTQWHPGFLCSRGNGSTQEGRDHRGLMGTDDRAWLEYLRVIGAEREPCSLPWHGKQEAFHWSDLWTQFLSVGGWSRGAAQAGAAGVVVSLRYADVLGLSVQLQINRRTLFFAELCWLAGFYFFNLTASLFSLGVPSDRKPETLCNR